MNLFLSWTVWRGLKFLGLMAFTLGIGAAVFGSSREQKLRATYLLAVPGFIATYAAGWWLMKGSGRSLTTPWLASGLFGGLTAIHLTFLVTFRDRVRRAASVLAAGGLSGAIVVMTLRPEGLVGAIVVLLLGGLIGGMATATHLPTVVTTTAADGPRAGRYLRAMARLEGGSLLLMLFVAMPSRMWFGVSLDGGTGLIGWTHGVITVLFLQSLHSTQRMLHWPKSALLVGAASSLVPGGSFWFERRLPPTPRPCTEV